MARSYISTLDLLVPVEASVSGVIGSEPAVIADERLKTVRDRYKKAMDYLKSADDSPGANGRSKLETYVQKQELWSKEVEKYTKAQHDALATVKPPQGATTKQIKEARELYLQWIQEHGRDVSLRRRRPKLEQLLTNCVKVQTLDSDEIHGLGGPRLQVHGMFDGVEEAAALSSAADP